MKMRILFFLCIVFTAVVIPVSAQFYESGHDPASIRWKQINTPHVCIIFPSGFDSAANRVANIFDFIYYNNTKGLNASPRKISIVLHNHSCYSNGFVTLAPRRMELYTTPPQIFTAQDWMSELAVHEFRHVAQIGKVNQGVTRLLYPFFGQLSSGMVAAALPMWFLEGDAVYAETVFTNSGRGRTGDFTMQLKSVIGEQKKLYSFEKSLFGSYKDYVPNHYYSGYYMVSSIRAKYGNTVFEKSLNYTARNPYIPFSFSYSLKKLTGKTARTHYKEIFTAMKLEVDDSSSRRTSYYSFAKNINSDFTSYHYPQKINDTTVIVAKSGLNDITKFVYTYRSGKEKEIYTPCNYSDTRFSYSCGKIAWSEEVPDLRWSNRSYSCIKIWDIQKRKLQWLSRKSRYFAPALSSDASKVAMVEITLPNEMYLVIMDVATAKVISRVRAPENLLLSDPSFTSDGLSVVSVATGDQGKAIYRFSLASGNWENLTGFSFYNLSCPTQKDQNLYFSSDYTGTNNIYSFRYSDKTIFRLTNAKNGAFEPFFITKDSSMFFSEYNSHGYSTKILKLAASDWKKFQFPTIYSDTLLLSGTKIEKFNFQDSILVHPEIVTHQNSITSYSKIGHMFNLHSWSPFYFDYNNLSLSNQQIYPGITLLSQDKLSTCISSVSYFNEDGTWKLKPRFIYKGWFPVVDLSLNYGGAIPYARRINKSAVAENGYIEFNSLIYVPFNLTRGRYITAVIPQVEIDYDNPRFFYTSDSTYRKGRTFASLGLNMYSYLKTSERDIAPKIGFSLGAKIKFTPFDQVQYGYIGYIKPRIYLPGLLAHHSLQLSGSYQYQDPRTYLYSSLVSFARGYDTHYTYKLLTFSCDYAFPVFYPDWNIGSLLYFKRLRANLFFDYARNRYIDRNSQKWVTYPYKSFGMDWLTDFHALRIYFPFAGGLRTIYLPKEHTVLYQFIFSADFSF